MIGHTCGIACWTAQDDVCHCSCGGANHGCLRTSDGVQPVRSKKIYGQFYELHSVHKGFQAIMKLHETKGMPPNSIRKTPTTAEIMKWPELTMFRDQKPIDRVLNPPICIWIPSNKYK